MMHRHHCLPSQLFAEDASFIGYLEIEEALEGGAGL